MNHIAIMKKEWGLTKKIIDGIKTVESRWYKSKTTPWNKIKVGDTVYFKDSGGPVLVKAKVTKVEQYEVSSNSQALAIMAKYALADLGTEVLSKSIRDYITGKKYAVFVHFNKVKKITPFSIDKAGFGMQCAWLTVDSINKIILN
jgi:ASC-1-like (ASCH) protein